MSELPRLRWRCRRGMKELDYILNQFLEKDYKHLTEQEKARFEQLLEVQDDRLWAWFFQKEAVEDEALAALVQRIRAGVGA